jgi:hypothetical protein
MSNCRKCLHQDRQQGISFLSFSNGDTPILRKAWLQGNQEQIYQFQ